MLSMRGAMMMGPGTLVSVGFCLLVTFFSSTVLLLIILLSSICSSGGGDLLFLKRPSYFQNSPSVELILCRSLRSALQRQRVQLRRTCAVQVRPRVSVISSSSRPSPDESVHPTHYTAAAYSSYSSLTRTPVYSSFRASAKAPPRCRPGYSAALARMSS